MSWELWVAFVVASTVLLTIPGPTVMLVVSYALGRGKSTGWATVPGVALGDLTAMTISLLGAGAVLAASSSLFTVLKLIGAGYLIWLGIQLWRAQPVVEALPDMAAGSSKWSMFRNAYIVTALNPKGIIFFVAFVPQFVDPAAPSLMQFAILECTFVTLAAVNVAIWALLAGQLRSYFKRRETLQFFNRLGAGFLVGAGLITASVRQGQ